MCGSCSMVNKIHPPVTVRPFLCGQNQQKHRFKKRQRELLYYVIFSLSALNERAVTHPIRAAEDREDQTLY